MAPVHRHNQCPDMISGSEPRYFISYMSPLAPTAVPASEHSSTLAMHFPTEVHFSLITECSLDTNIT